MKKTNNAFSVIVDYFLILSAIIGVGFASGKEICVFFFDFGSKSFIGLISFGLLYIYLFFVVEYVKNKLKLNTYNEFNQKMFGKLCKFSNIVLVINFSITSAGMLAGADYLFKTFFGVGYRIPSIILTVLTFLLLLGGINKIKIVANIIIPLMIAVIVINSIGNINPQNVNFEITKQNSLMALYFGLLFGVNNFVAALPVLFETKLKNKGKFLVILTICVIILLNILVFASNNFSTDMPMFELSANVSVWFYYIYFATIVLALFSTLMICSYNMQSIFCKGKRSVFVSIIIVLVNLILSNLGYAFIVKYLYVVSGIFSGIYVITLIVMMIIRLIKHNKLKNKTNKNSFENRINNEKLDKNDSDNDNK